MIDVREADCENDAHQNNVCVAVWCNDLSNLLIVQNEDDHSDSVAQHTEQCEEGVKNCGIQSKTDKENALSQVKDGV